MADVYAAGEEPIPSATSEKLVEEMRASGHPRARYLGRRADMAALIAPELREGDILITLGAGDIWQTGEEILKLRGKDVDEKVPA